MSGVFKLMIDLWRSSCTCLKFLIPSNSVCFSWLTRNTDRAMWKSVQGWNFKILRIYLNPNKCLAQNFGAWIPQVERNLNFSSICGYSENFIISIYFCFLIWVDWYYQCLWLKTKWLSYDTKIILNRNKNVNKKRKYSFLKPSVWIFFLLASLSLAFLLRDLFLLLTLSSLVFPFRWCQ